MFQKKEKKKNKKKITLPFQNFGIGKEREYLVENLSMLVGSGMGIPFALESIKSEMRSRRMKNVLASILESVDAGVPFWRALESVKIFPPYMVSLIRTGEESGNLSENLKVVALQDQKERQFRSKIRSAMMYPIFVLGLTMFVGIGIAWFILPRLAIVFSQLKLELPLVTRMLILTGEFLGEYGAIAVPLFLVFVGVIVYLVFIFQKTKFIGQTMLFYVPGAKGLIQEVELARFGYLLGSLLGAGLPVVNALDSLYQATTFPMYKKMYAHIRDSIEEGNSFQKSFKSYDGVKKLVPSPIQQMIVAGEQSGNLSKILIKIGETFEIKTEDSTKNLAVILEPVLLIIVWLGVVAVALAVILPIYSLIGGFN